MIFPWYSHSIPENIIEFHSSTHILPHRVSAPSASSSPGPSSSSPVPWDTYVHRHTHSVHTNVYVYIYIYIYPLVNQHNYGKSPFLMGKSTISMAIFQFTHCKRLPGRVSHPASRAHPSQPVPAPAATASLRPPATKSSQAREYSWL